MKNNNLKYILAIVFGIAIGYLGFSMLAPAEEIHEHEAGETKTLYTCGMHPDIIEEEPGTCPICGMNLTPINNSSEKDSAGENIVFIDGSVIQNMNVKIDEVKEGELSPSILTNGILKIAEDSEYSINTKVGGWIENLYINSTGQKIKKGEKLLDIYSPELLAAQQEVISALSLGEKNDNSIMLQSALDKLRLLDISQKEIDKIITSKQVNKYIPIYAPYNGTVLEKKVVEGEKIKVGQELVKLANLNRLWIIADLYENEIGLVSEGDSAIITQPNKTEKYKGIVSFIYPVLDPVSRTVKVRIEIANNDSKLKPNMFASVFIKTKSPGQKLLIPESAVLRSGKRNLVVASLGEGKFKTVEVELGDYSNGEYELLSGLNKGDKFVKSGQFMIDSESNLQAAVNIYSSENSDIEIENDSELIREGIIDVESIDKNKDGKVFQDPMDWNVISDKDGRCPICNMFLKEVTIEEAKTNLKKHGFKYK